MPFSIDSDAPEQSSDKNSGEVLKSLTEVTMDIQMTKQGKIVSIIGADKLEEKINTLTNEQFKQMFSQQFSEKAILASLENLSSYFPNKPIAVNDSWDVAKTINTNGIELIHQMKLRLNQVKSNLATIECTGTIATPEGGGVLSVQGMEAQVSVNGEQTGTFQVDLKTGWIIRSESMQKMTQQIEIMGQSIPQEMEVKTVITAD